MDSSEQIEQRAAEWIVRRAGEDWTADDQAQLDEWLKSSMAHCAAFWRLEAAWENSARLQALGAGGRAGAVPPRGEWQVSLFFDQRPAEEAPPPAANSKPRRFRLAALAAGVLFVFGIAAYLSTAQRGDHYATPVGGSASIPLKDGSTVVLNTASDIRVVLTDRERLVHLNEGEAFFDVARDRLRPFVVQAGDRRVVAVGTRFSVQRMGNDVKVTVTEGAVRVERSGREAATKTLLRAGTIAQTADVRLAMREKTPSEAEEALSWRGGYLTFNATPLKDAIAEFNRYTSNKIVLEDQLPTFHVTGRFRTNNVEAFLRVLNQGFGVQSRRDGDAIVLTDGRSSAP